MQPPADSTARRLTDQLTRAEKSGLIAVAQLEPEMEYLFRHALVQDAAYFSLLKEQRRTIHRAIGEALEALYPDRLGELAPLLAQHFDQGDAPAAALRYYTLAGDSAAERYANDEAIMAYGRALALARQVEGGRERLLHLYTRKGRAEQLSGRHDEALATYEAMEGTAREIGDPALELASLNQRATIYSTFTSRADPELGMALSERALALARQIGDEPAQATILWNLMLVNSALGRSAESVRHGEASLAIARRLGLGEQTAYTLHDLSSILVTGGQAERAAALNAEAQAQWRALGNRAMLADSLIAGATLRVVQGRYAEGLAMVEEGLEISRAIGNAWGQSYAHMGLGYVNLVLENLGEALTHCRECVRLAEAAGFRFGQVYAGCIEALILAYLRQPEMAQARIETARAAAPDDGTVIAVMPLLFEMGIQLDLGDLAKAQAALDEAERLDWGDPAPRMMTAIMRAELLLAHGRPLEAVGATEALLTQPPPLIEANLFLYPARVTRGRAQLAAGDAAAARASLEALVGEMAHNGARFYFWEGLAALAEAAEAQGDTARAAAARADARAEIERLVGQIGDAGLVETFKGREDVRAVMGG